MTGTQLAVKVKDFMNRSDLTDSPILDMMNAVIVDLERKETYRHMEQVDTATLLSGTYSIDLPVRYKKILSLKFLVGNRQYPTERKSEDFVMRVYPDLVANQGRPELISLLYKESKILLRPTCDASYTYCLRYHQFSDTIRGNDSNFWTTEAWDVLLFGTLAISQAYVKDEKRTATWKSLFDNAYTGILKYQIEEELSGSHPQGSTDYLIQQGNDPYPQSGTFIV